MHLEHLDLNLLRLFDAVYRLRNVSRAAEALNLSQPAASQGLTRLRLQLKDPLFMRAAGGVRPTPRAQRLAAAVQSALGALEQALGEFERFDPAASRMALRLHLSDIGEARFLPALMAALGREAPGIEVKSVWRPHGEIAAALDGGQLDFAIGFLPTVLETRQQPLLRDRYVLLVSAAHPLAARAGAVDAAALQALEFVAVRSHGETLRILQQLGLQERVRLACGNFLALPAIVRSTALAAVLPRDVALDFAAHGGCAVLEAALPSPEFTVSLHWSRRFEADAAQRWVRELLLRLFGQAAA
ncbi:LysR family transcriptional regulator [Azohydromonas aeria]|uniref:LysR family transcriptional regulator n=1 Tax=Azohydromonas aeria TaxID=2590212 RepID=UPI0012FB8138|nr:LysR family transcriptional regulator [Azohydromonas aeria]